MKIGGNFEAISIFYADKRDLRFEKIARAGTHQVTISSLKLLALRR